jgi:hypothetical protein
MRRHLARIAPDVDGHGDTRPEDWIPDQETKQTPETAQQRTAGSGI